MGDMKSLLSDFSQSYNNSGIPTKITLSFPVSLQLEAGGMVNLSDYKIGGFLNYAGTKGVIGYRDYSGSINESVYHRSLCPGIDRRK